MANAKQHKKAGQFTGGAVALYRARHQPAPLRILLEAAGGVVAGGVGAGLYDAIEPATTPNHRGFGHSMVANGTAAQYVVPMLDLWEDGWRESAAEWEAMAKRHDLPPGKRALYGLLSLWASFMAGTGSGFVAGAASHLVLDSATPRGLPLLMKAL